MQQAAATAAEVWFSCQAQVTRYSSPSHGDGGQAHNLQDSFREGKIVVVPIELHYSVRLEDGSLAQRTMRVPALRIIDDSLLLSNAATAEVQRASVRKNLTNYRWLRLKAPGGEIALLHML